MTSIIDAIKPKQFSFHNGVPGSEEKNPATHSIGPQISVMRTTVELKIIVDVMVSVAVTEL